MDTLRNKAVDNFERDFGFGLDNMKSKTLKITKFYLSLCNVKSNEYSTVSYLGKQVKFVIEECTLGRNLKRGVDVNKFVVNIFRDREIKLSLATYLHRKSLESGTNTLLENFLSKKLKFSNQEIDELLSEDRPNYADDRFKTREVVTWIVGGAYLSEEIPSKKRSLKKEEKEEEEEEEKEQKLKIEETKQNPSKESSLADSEEHFKSKRTYKGKKPRVKRIMRKIECDLISHEEDKEVAEESEVEVPLSKIKMEDRHKEEIKNILTKTDFINTKESENIKKPLPLTRKAKRQNMSRFRDYMQWYDEKCMKSINSSESRGSTNKSTPLKSFLKKTEEIRVENIKE